MNLQERRRQLKLSEPTNEHNGIQAADNDKNSHHINLGSVLCLALVFLSFVALLYTIYSQLPTLEAYEHLFYKINLQLNFTNNHSIKKRERIH
jgi:hypothetical protein